MSGKVWLDLAIGVGAALAATWLVLAAALLIARPQGGTLRQALRLLRRLAADTTQPAGIRIRLVLLWVYLASPIDVIPDVIPVIGYADDAIVVIWTLRAIARRAGVQALRGHWPGTQDGFTALCRITGLPQPATPR